MFRRMFTAFNFEYVLDSILKMEFNFKRFDGVNLYETDRTTNSLNNLFELSNKNSEKLESLVTNSLKFSKFEQIEVSK